jgi:hypothetical protein
MRNPNIGGLVGEPRLIKYYFLKSDFQKLIDSGVIEKPDFLGVAFGNFQHGDSSIRAKEFWMSATLDHIITPTETFATATAVTEDDFDAFRPHELDGFDFAFLDKVQLKWFLDEMSNIDRLCLSDCYVNLADTPPYTKDTPYPTFKIWVEKATEELWMKTPNATMNNFPRFSILTPCPPVWPEIPQFIKSLSLNIRK